VEGPLIKGLVLVILGALQIAWMIWAIRTDAASTKVSIVEAAILKVADAEPLPKSRAGIAFDRLQIWMGLALGVVIFGLGILVLSVE
jgi:hypothetical protein